MQLISYEMDEQSHVHKSFGKVYQFGLKRLLETLTDLSDSPLGLSRDLSDSWLAGFHLEKCDNY